MLQPVVGGEQERKGGILGDWASVKIFSSEGSALSARTSVVMGVFFCMCVGLGFHACCGWFG